tara:strand:- start:12593 stop:12937 length:345 start_codon:yes stop_codon:yes gene_type:complete
MKRLKSKYISGANGQAINGRTRIYSLFYAGTHTDLDAMPILEFKDGDSSGDTLLYANDSLSTFDDSSVYNDCVSLDLPPEGVLFPSGVYVTSTSWTVTDGTIGVCIFFEGGAAA